VSKVLHVAPRAAHCCALCISPNHKSYAIPCPIVPAPVLGQ
jgi:hypothetical protein